MSKDKISDYSETPGNNTDIGGINIAEGMLPSDVNNAIREQMAQLKKFQSGASGESVTFATVRVVTSINDTNGNELFGVTATGSAVNEFTVANAATGNAPTLSATGGDTNIGMALTPKGTGGVIFPAGAVGTPAITTSGDTNTGIFFPAADQVAIATNGVERVSLGNSATVFNDGGADVDFRVEGDTDANLLFVDASADRVGIGTNTLGAKLHVSGTSSAGYVGSFLDNTATNGYARFDLRIGSSGGSGLATIKYAPGIFMQIGPDSNDTTTPLTFATNNATERARITSAGNFLVGQTAENFGAAGVYIEANGTINAIVNQDAIVNVNRLGNDGNLIRFYQATVEEGNISVSGNTVSYNPFLGSHSGALTDWSRPDIKIGTVMDTINELLEYKVVVIDVQEDIPAKDAVLDEEGNEVEPAQEATTQTVQKRISYNGNGAVGSTATVEYEGQEYTGTIQHEREEPLSFNKHLKVKINDTAASKTVFGVFVGWNNDSNNDGGVYNDMLVGAVGNYVIRMAAGQTPEAGDLVEADGNGCAVVQDDDIIRTKTIAKVTSTIPQVIYDDGSFLVTCVLYCG